MKIKLMRIVDYWLGIPLCFLFSLVNTLTKLLFFWYKSSKSIPCNIAFIKLSELGAIILSYPLLAQVKKETGGRNIFCYL